MGRKILVQDDSPTILNLLGMVLKSQGYEVFSALDGLAGLRVLRNQDIDLVISDVNMPRMDGLTFVTQVRKMQQFQDLPIILLTTQKDPKLREKGLSKGADLFLLKPLPPASLVEHVRALLP